jgi:hypothetical protein
MAERASWPQSYTGNGSKRYFSPGIVVITTPNADYNRFLGVPDHRFCHPDHHFEWGRKKFRSWAGSVGRRNGDQVRFDDVVAAHPIHGGPTQIAVFHRTADKNRR